MNTSATKVVFAILLCTVVAMTFLRARPEGATGSDVVEVSFSFWGSYEEWAMWREIADQFEAKNPDVRVKLEYIPSNYEDKIQLLLAADSAPDVMLIQDEPFPGYANYGKFADLSGRAYGPDAPVDWDTAFWPTAAESFFYKGRVHGVPVFGGNVLVYYNREMFDDLGVAPPEDDWTFDEFIAKGKELTRDTNGDGRLDTFGFSLPSWIYFLPWTWGFGANYLNDACTDWAFTGPEALAATKFFQDLRFSYHVSPSVQEVPGMQELAMFMTGRIGMTVSGPWNSPGLITAGIDFDVVHIPVGPAGERYTRVTWDSLCLFDKSEHKEEAWRFMRHCISYEAQGVIGKFTRSIPALQEAQDTFIKPDNGWSEEKFVDALSYARMQPISKHWQEMNQVLNPVYEQLLLNKVTPEEALEEMAEGMREEKVFPLDSRE